MMYVSIVPFPLFIESEFSFSKLCREGRFGHKSLSMTYSTSFNAITQASITLVVSIYTRMVKVDPMPLSVSRSCNG